MKPLAQQSPPFRANRTLALRLTEKETLAPIVDLIVRVDVNTITVMSTHTGRDGRIPIVTGLRDNDRVDVSVRRLEGGFKTLMSFRVSSAQNDFTLFSPKTKALIPTDDHFIAGTGEAEISNEIEVEQSMGTDLSIRKVRTASCHPKVILSAGKCSEPVLPYQCTIENLLFPLFSRPSESYHERPRKFGALREKGRLHAGIDLYSPLGTPIRVMADGIVMSVRTFYLGTDAVIIDHGEFIGRYCEVKKGSANVKEGQRVTRGQQIAQVGKMTGISQTMLHLEMYANCRSKLDLTDTSAPPYSRREDLIDPTPSIDIAVME